MKSFKTVRTTIVFLVFISYINNADASPSTVRPNKLVFYSISEGRALKMALGYHEDTYLNFTELTSKYKYECEVHTITTEDGYVLTVFRILPKCLESPTKYPVLLMHGLNDNSDDWILAGPQIGLGYLLANKCYDVWAANLRGNNYSRKHIKLNPDKDPEYWNYSFEEHGSYDIPAIIDYISNVTRREKVNYIGHSQGTTDFFAMTSIRPEYNKNIQLSLHLAPIAWMKYMRNPLLKMISSEYRNIKNAVDSSGFSEISAKHHLLHPLVEFICEVTPGVVCSTLLYFFSGYIEGISRKNIAVAFGHLLAGTSAKSYAHFGQLVNSGRFQRYDEGTVKNLKMYGTSMPPEYNISLITSPVVLICAQNDWLSTLKDIDILASKLPNLLEKYVVPVPTWSHPNHLWDINAPKYIFSKILDYLQRFN